MPDKTFPPRRQQRLAANINIKIKIKTSYSRGMEMMRWCREVFDAHDAIERRWDVYWVWHHDGDCIAHYAFRYQEDATLFELTWC